MSEHHIFVMTSFLGNGVKEALPIMRSKARLRNYESILDWMNIGLGFQRISNDFPDFQVDISNTL